MASENGFSLPLMPPGGQGEAIEVWPEYGGGSIANWAGTVLEHFRRLSPDVAGPDTPPAPSIAPPIDPSRHVPLPREARVIVCLTVDAFGYYQLLEHLGAGNMPNLEQLLNRGGKLGTLTSVFPSTTATALTSLNTGLTPLQHGFASYTMWLPDQRAVGNLISFRTMDTGQRITGADDLMSFPTLYQRLEQLGVPAWTVQPATLDGTELTRALYRGARLVGYESPSSITVKVEAIVQELLASGRPGFVYAYWPFLDGVAHQAGTQSPEYAAEALLVDHLLFGWLRKKSFDGQVAAFVLADHGQLTLSAAQRMLLNRSERLLELLDRPPAGERRSMYVKARDGQAAALRQAILDEFRFLVDVLDAREMLDRGLFGPVDAAGGGARERLLDRVGDLIVLPKPGGQLHYAYSERDRDIFKAGGHGGLATDEMAVPLFSIIR